MEKKAGVGEVARRFHAIFDDVVEQRTPYVVTRDDRPEAVLIPYADFLRYRQADERRILDQFDRLVARMASQDATVNESELANDIDLARSQR